MYRFCETHYRQFRDERGCEVCLDEMHQKERLEERLGRVTIHKAIPQVSKQKAAREYQLSKVRVAKKKVVKGCQSCDKPEGPLDYSHTLSVKQFPAYEADPDNAVIECRKCHRIWENGTLADKMKLKTWKKRLEYILSTEPSFFNKMQLKAA